MRYGVSKDIRSDIYKALIGLSGLLALGGGVVAWFVNGQIEAERKITRAESSKIAITEAFSKVTEVIAEANKAKNNANNAKDRAEESANKVKELINNSKNSLDTIEKSTKNADGKIAELKLTKAQIKKLETQAEEHARNAETSAEKATQASQRLLPRITQLESDLSTLQTFLTQKLETVQQEAYKVGQFQSQQVVHQADFWNNNPVNTVSRTCPTNSVLTGVEFEMTSKNGVRTITKMIFKCS